MDVIIYTIMISIVACWVLLLLAIGFMSLTHFLVTGKHVTDDSNLILLIDVAIPIIPIARYFRGAYRERYLKKNLKLLVLIMNLH